jgi:hypothetical protein
MMMQKTSASLVERRACPRHACPAGSWQVSVLGDSVPRTARVRDLSASGIGLLFEDKVNVDKMVVVELFNPIRHCWYLKTIRMLYSVPQPDGRYLTGGSFLHPLTEDDCREVLLDPLREGRSLFQEEAADRPAPARRAPRNGFTPQA